MQTTKKIDDVKTVTILRQVEQAILGARIAAGRIDDANGDRLTAKQHRVYPCNQAIVHATQEALDAVREILRQQKKDAQ